jgi:hypothetical protein
VNDSGPVGLAGGSPTNLIRQRVERSVRPTLANAPVPRNPLPRASFNPLQNYGSAPSPVVYYVFDVMVFAGRDVMREPLETRQIS